MGWAAATDRRVVMGGVSLAPHSEILYFQSTLKTTGIVRDRPCSIHRRDPRKIVADGTSKHTFRASGRRQGTYDLKRIYRQIRVRTRHVASEFVEIDVENNRRNKSEQIYVGRTELSEACADGSFRKRLKTAAKVKNKKKTRRVSKGI